MTAPRLRVLMLADDCNPDWPSLPAVGWQTCRAMAEYVDATVATHVRNRPAIAAKGLGRARVVYLDNEYVAAPLFRLFTWLRGGAEGAWTAGIALSYPSYLAFEWEAWKRFRDELAEGAFDLVHRVTPMSPTLPSLLARRSPVPFVLGPLNGGLPWPPSYAAELRSEREYLRYLREAHRWLPFHRSTYRRAAAVLAAFPHTLHDLPPDVEDRAFDFPEVGIDPERFRDPAVRAEQGPLELLFAGRLVPYKCPDVAVEAFLSDPALHAHRLRIVGDGPERADLERRVARAGLGDRVEFLGWRSQDEVAEAMGRAHVFVFPSIRELGAGAVVEAMACGCVPVVVDYGGPASLVGEGCGIRLPLGPKDELVRSLASALRALADDRARMRAMGEAARARALERFSWSAKARKMLEVYEWVLGRREGRPTFEEPPRIAGAP